MARKTKPADVAAPAAPVAVAPDAENTEMFSPEDMAPVGERTEVPDAKGVVVHDESGIPLYRKLNPKYDPDTGRKVREKPRTKKRERVYTDSTKLHASLLEFPTDRWGVAKDLKTAYIQTVSRIAGDEAKLELVQKTLAVLNQYLQDKFESDKVTRELTIKRNADKAALRNERLNQHEKPTQSA